VTRKLGATVGLVLALSPVQADFPARVIGITDGDTIKVLDESNTQHKIRLAGIDAPERKQLPSAPPLRILCPRSPG
jgi:endonuclease YncB( thermonuclease family)